MTDPLTISVVIPVYNGERFLAEAIRSVLDQTLLPDEIIVVDDGSTDGTAAVAAGLANTSPLPMCYIYQENQGPAAARNAGVAIAAGDLLAFLDADDLWLPAKLDRQMQLLHTSPWLGYVGCHVQPQLISGQEWPIIFRQAYWKSHPPTFASSALLIRRATWEQVGPFDTNRRLGEDADWVMHARDLGIEAAVTAEVLLIKRIHDQNLSYRARNMGRDLVAALHASLRRKKNK
jgi:glycosyltransferase involved in cell wall biosynthesis